jgi:hypothetical protein
MNLNSGTADQTPSIRSSSTTSFGVSSPMNRYPLQIVVDDRREHRPRTVRACHPRRCRAPRSWACAYPFGSPPGIQDCGGAYSEESVQAGSQRLVNPYGPKAYARMWRRHDTTLEPTRSSGLGTSNGTTGCGTRMSDRSHCRELKEDMLRSVPGTGEPAGRSKLADSVAGGSPERYFAEREPPPLCSP